MRIIRPNDKPIIDPKFDAALKMVGRTGANRFSISYDDGEGEEREHPAIWNAVAIYKKQFGDVYEVAAGFNPERAVFRLLERLVDGAMCTHCHRPTGITDDIDAMPLEKLYCWYQYDPELKVYRRGCEGDK